MILIRYILIIIGALTISNISFAQICKDSSFRIAYSSPGVELTAHHLLSTADKGDLVIGRCRQATTVDNFMLKIAPDGTVQWSKKLSYSSGGITDLLINKVVEGRDQSLWISGRLDSLGFSTSVYLAKISASGNVLWEKEIANSLFTGPETKFNIDVMTEADNNEMLIGGNLYDAFDSRFAMLYFKVDGNGNILWSKGFEFLNQSGVADIVGMHSVGNELSALGMFQSGTDGCNLQHLLRFFTIKLNSNNGNLITWNKYSTDLPVDPAGSILVNASGYLAARNSVKMTNGEYRMAGVAYGYELSAGNYVANNYIISFDQDLAYKSARLFRFGDRSAFYTAFNKKGDAMLALTGAISNTFYYGTLFNGYNEIAAQRKVTLSPGYVATGVNGTGLLSFKNDHAFSCVTNLVNGSNRILELGHLQPDDLTEKDCTGEDTSYLKNGTLLNLFSCGTPPDIISNSLLTATAFVSGIGNLPIIPIENCRKEYTCTKLVIEGPDSVCLFNQPYEFKARLNGECKKRVTWHMDPQYIQSLNVLNDSMVRVIFKTPTFIASNVKLYASVGSCDIVGDSMDITVRNIGVGLLQNGKTDSMLCPGAQIKLTPGNWFSDYLWNDNSTDSVLYVSDPGTYTCRVRLCGNFFTIPVTVHANNKVITLGNDTTICDNEVVLLKATPGYTQYTWTPAYNLSQVSDVTATVAPAVDTQYVVSATISPGCTIRDTILVSVKKIPRIDLGNDTAICAAENIMLNGPAGFATYEWSTGSTNQVIRTTGRGIYWLQVKDAIGCKTRDTIEVKDAFCEDKIFFPGSFSPDGNGKNDIFKPVIKGTLDKYEMNIYNRWGQRIFQTTDPYKGWDGRWQGYHQPANNYIWICQYRFAGKLVSTQKGLLILTR